MRKLALVAAVVFALSVPAFAGNQDDTITTTGYIIDSHCAQKSAEAGKAVCCKKEHAAGSAEFQKCILACSKEKDVKLGILYKDSFWALDNQDLARQNLGTEVTIKGTADPDTKVFKVEEIRRTGEKKS